ncbi:MAG: SMI1/KNR4 family protein [Pirellula sp.]
MSIENMITTIEALADKEVGSGASAEAIQAVEQSLEIRIPKDYDAFLRTYGWARLMYDELYGVGDSVPEHLDLIANTVRERADFRPYLPKYLVPVLADGAGNHYCLDLSNADTGTCPVVFWDHEQGETQTPKIIGRTFSDWIAEHVTERA